MFANTHSFDSSSDWSMDHTMVVSSVHNPLPLQLAGPYPPSAHNATAAAFDMLNLDFEDRTKNLTLAGAAGGSSDPLCDPAFLEAMAFNQQFLSLPPFVDNTFTQPLENQNSQNIFDTSKWPDFTNSFLPQANDAGFNFKFN